MLLIAQFWVLMTGVWAKDCPILHFSPFSLEDPVLHKKPTQSPRYPSYQTPQRHCGDSGFWLHPCGEYLSLIRFWTVSKWQMFSLSWKKNINCGLLYSWYILVSLSGTENRTCPSRHFTSASESQSITPTCHYTGLPANNSSIYSRSTQLTPKLIIQ